MSAGPPGEIRVPDDWAELDDLNAALQHLMRVAALARPALGRRLDLTLSETWALEHLAGEPLGPVELSRRLHVTSAAGTALVHRLEAAGHVVRAPHPLDRRRTVLRPTPEGMSSLFAELAPLVRDLAAAGADLEGRDRRLVADYLTRVAAVLTAFVADGEGLAPAAQAPDGDPPSAG